MTTKEAAAQLDVGPATVAMFRRQGKLKGRLVERVRGTKARPRSIGGWEWDLDGRSVTRLRRRRQKAGLQ